MNRLGTLVKNYRLKVESALSRVVLPAVVLLGISDSASAIGNLGTLASSVQGSLNSFVPLIISGCYVAGLALAGAAILKFKAHKDNPTQVPLGTPISLLFIAAGLLWMPSLISSTAATVGFTSQETLSGPNTKISF